MRTETTASDETRRSERNIFITSNDASIVARDVRAAPRGVAQIDRNILRHVIGELTVPMHRRIGAVLPYYVPACRGCLDVSFPFDSKRLQVST